METHMIERTFQALYIPLGSVWYSRGRVSFGSKPMISVEIPNGLTPPDWVYRCGYLSFLRKEIEKCRHLLNTRYMTRYIFDSDGIFYR